jgi:hypothetical protein
LPECRLSVTEEEPSTRNNTDKAAATSTAAF